ncbi:hypothetical protein [Crossiella sp. CA198]|uniref:hypothetical protein n=1 Tax=Crossiella sp. CA198 TaxID=3455607 RepID=UPI003F8D7E68
MSAGELAALYGVIADAVENMPLLDYAETTDRVQAECATVLRTSNRPGGATIPATLAGMTGDLREAATVAAAAVEALRTAARGV